MNVKTMLLQLIGQWNSVHENECCSQLFGKTCDFVKRVLANEQLEAVMIAIFEDDTSCVGVILSSPTPLYFSRIQIDLMIKVLTAIANTIQK